LRASALALMEVLTDEADAQPASAGPHRALVSLQALQARCRHPLVQVRHWRAQSAHAARRGDTAGALAAACEQAAVAQRAGLLEWLCEALLLIARFDTGGAADDALRRGQALARAQHFGWLLSTEAVPPRTGGRA
jgi:hypothetical protein